MHLRVGPWTRASKAYLVTMLVALAHLKPASVATSLDPTFPVRYTGWWWYNVVGFAWTAGVLYIILFCPRKPYIYGVLATYTIQSWVYLILRHGLTALSPFLDHSSSSSFGALVLRTNEVLRFLSLVTATVTFFAWNLVLAPTIWYLKRTPRERRAFLIWNTRFRMVNIHNLNILLAWLVNVRASPRRAFVFDDLWCSGVALTAYTLFYVLVFDRLGMHLYPVFSPRTPLMIATWSALLAFYYGSFVVWNRFVHA